VLATPLHRYNRFNAAVAMGGNSSKTEEKTAVVNEKPQIIVEKSTGFHMVELHLPSMGVSFVALLTVLILGIVLYKAYSQYKKHRLRRRQQRQYGGHLLPTSLAPYPLGERACYQMPMGLGISPVQFAAAAAAFQNPAFHIPPLQPTGAETGPASSTPSTRRFETNRFTEVEDDPSSMTRAQARAHSSTNMENV